uniref:anthocyanidin 3-O-glucosyltransferase n=1 Tax=Linum usitatissimum TaxID=4006 RepID=I2BH91_LINUS|nr:UDP-glycosyltransferase 1 [Linum usitatissimum]
MPTAERKSAHLLVVPAPGTGHVNPLLKFSHKLANHGGVRVTVVNDDFIHNKVMAAASKQAKDEHHSLVRLVGIPDGRDPAKLGREKFGEGAESRSKVMAGHLKKLIEEINGSEEGLPISCVVSDGSTAWALEIGREMGIKCGVVSPVAVINLSLTLHIPKLIQSGILSPHGLPLKNEAIVLPNQGELPPWQPNELPWHHPNPQVQKHLFKQYTLKQLAILPQCDWILSNTFPELEPFACQLNPDTLPIGPLLQTPDPTHFHGNFWGAEDPTCITWLDQQSPASVIYVAFGSTANMTQCQFEELALGLERSGKPFLWVVRSDIVADIRGGDGGKPQFFPSGFLERVVVDHGGRGKIVEWCSQEDVLAHPSTSCFLSHCGWNSTIEGVSYGVPFLCWPYFGDQMYNKRYICEVWKVGLGLDHADDESGSKVVTRFEIARKIQRLMCDDGIKANVVRLKEMAVKSLSPGGSSSTNLHTFIQQLC